MSGKRLEAYRDFTIHEHSVGLYFRHVTHAPGADRNWGHANDLDQARRYVDDWHLRNAPPPEPKIRARAPRQPISS